MADAVVVEWYLDSVKATEEGWKFGAVGLSMLPFDPVLPSA